MIEVAVKISGRGQSWLRSLVRDFGLPWLRFPIMVEHFVVEKSD